MNYNYLLYFSVLAETEHYTQAAARLGISQPSLSSAIHNLESDLGGIKLFEKSGRNIRLTKEGRFYQQKVSAALNDLHSASITLKYSKEDAPVVIRLGLVSGTLNGIVAEEITSYIRENKRVRFQLIEGSAEHLMMMLQQEKLDMAIVDTTARDPSFHFRRLYNCDIYVAMYASHPLADREVLQPHEVIRLPQVVFNYDVGNSFQEWASGAPTDENVICQVNTAELALDLVEAGTGIAFIPDNCLRDRENIRYIPLNNWHQELYMCILYDKWLEPILWNFREKLINSILQSVPEQS